MKLTLLMKWLDNESQSDTDRLDTESDGDIYSGEEPLQKDSRQYSKPLQYEQHEEDYI